MRRAAPFLAAAALALAGIAPVLAVDAGPAVPRFVEETREAGIESVYAGGWEYMVGGGAAAFDCDGDRMPDLFLSGGEGVAALYRNRSAVGGPLRFEPTESGLEIERVAGAYPLDADGDGMTDLALLRVGENLLMRGLGDCRFERANERWGFDGGDAWSAALAAIWEHGETWPTIAVGNYIDRREEGFPWGSCTDNWLHRPGADGTGFGAPLALQPSHCALSMLFTDWNRSGTPALRISNDREYYKGGEEQLWRVEPGAPPRLYSADEGWERLRIWGMGIASRDLDDDGFPEYFLTSMADNKLQTLDGAADADDRRPTYRDVAFARGVTAHRPYVGDNVKPSTAWHAQFEDVNNDGRADLFIAKGNVAEMPDFAAEDPNNLLLQASDGNFVEAGHEAGVASTAIARGAVLTDFNLDGFVDLAVVNRWRTAQLWRNTGDSGGGWLQVALEQGGANRDAIGAWIEVRLGATTMRREIAIGGGHASGQAGWWHFGLGERETAELRVIWPDGEAGEWQKVRADTFQIVTRGAGARPWRPR